jgi:hypothetical protein
MNPLEEVDKSIMARPNILHSLIIACHENRDKDWQMDILREVH